MSRTVAILGAGKIGQAVAHLLAGGQSDIRFWDNDNEQLAKPATLQETVTGASVVFLCVPTFATRQVLTDALPHLLESCTVVSLSKGVEPDSNSTVSEVLVDVLNGARPYALLSGPMLADEITFGLPAAAVLASTDEQARMVVALFSGAPLTIELSSDPHSVALAGVMKNVYALLIGIAEGLSLGSNAKGYLTSLAVREMSDVITALGGDRRAAYGTAGLGDFAATASSPFSRNRQVGEAIIRGGSLPTCEGVPAVSALAARLGDDLASYRLLSLLNRILQEHGDAEQIFKGLFAA